MDEDITVFETIDRAAYCGWQHKYQGAFGRISF